MKLFIFFYLFFSLSLSAQNAEIEKLLKNKDITWVAEGTDSLLMDQSINELVGTPRKIILKVLSEDNNFLNPEDVPDLASLIINASTNKSFELYSDPELKYRMTSNPFERTDTVEIYDPLTFKREIRITHSMLNPEDITAYKFNYVLFYNADKATFDFYPLALAPLKTYYDEVGNTLFNTIRPNKWKNELENAYLNSNFDSVKHEVLKAISTTFPVCYIKLKFENSTPALTSNDINWAVRFRRRGGKLLNDFKVLKSTKGNLFQQVLEKVKNDNRIPIWDYNGLKITDTRIRNELFVKTDTIELTDPTTFEKKFKVTTANLDYNTCQGIKLVYDWFWDKKKSKLIMKLVVTAPNCNAYDEAGNFIYTYPLFYLLTKRK